MSNNKNKNKTKTLYPNAVLALSSHYCGWIVVSGNYVVQKYEWRKTS